MLSETLPIMNRRLFDKYGSNLSGLAKYRVVFANDQYEKRLGKFRDFNGIIFLREIEEVREVPKYPYAKDCYVLEKLDHYLGTEVVNHNGYEPLYVFKDINGNPLDPIWRAIEMIIYVSLNPEKISPGTMSDNEAKEYEKEIAFMENYLENQSPEIASALHDGVAITVPDLSLTKEN